MTELVTAALSRDDARSLTDEVKHDATQLWAKLVRLYDGGAHLALGYSSWATYCKEEFGFGQSHAYRLLDAGRALDIVPQLGNEAQARELIPLLNQPDQAREAWAETLRLHPQPTAADVRDVVRSRMDVHYSSTTDDWATPQDLFDVLNREFAFDVDVCASPETAKCARYFTAADDGLAQDWTGTCWMNPPYGDVISQWIAKAYTTGQLGTTVVCLVPARVDTGWWWNFCRYGEIRFLRGRLRFGGGTTAAPFPSAVVVFPRSPNVIWWEP